MNIFSLNLAYSTTRLVVKFPDNSNENQYNQDQIMQEGGLRKYGYYKSSYYNSSLNNRKTENDCYQFSLINLLSKLKLADAQFIPLVSIITVVFNGKQYIEEAIKSVLLQDYPNIEYLIIDGGSTDGTLEILKKYDSVIDYWASKPDKGIYDAMNQGITLAKGELIGILNSDDWYELNAVSQVVESSWKNPEASIFHGRMNVYDANGKYITTQTHRNYPLYRLISTPFKHPTCFLKRNIYEKFGKFNLEYKYVADYDLMLRLIKNNVKSYFINSSIANLRKVGVTTSKYSILNQQEIRDIIKKYSNNYLLFGLICLLRVLIKKIN